MTAPAPEFDLPPPSTPEAAALARLIGRAAALALIERHGGARIAVPRTVNQASTLARQIGLEAARALADRHGGLTLKIPLAKSWRALIYRRRDGLSYAAIARRLGAAESSVWAWLHEAGATVEGAPADSRQLDLFAPPDR